MTVAATTPTTSTAASASSSSSSSSLSSLAGNFSDFLKLLMTQLQNQDPTTPMDTNQFTSQLVQYSSVEQQINTNANLTKLITATQSNTLIESSSLVGKTVDVTSDHLTLQDSSATVHFTAPSAETLNITVKSSSGEKLYTTTVAAQAGNNDWTWNGLDNAGNQVADGSYQVSVTDPSQAAISTTVTGTITGLQRDTSGINLSLGALSTSIDNVQSVSTSN